MGHSDPLQGNPCGFEHGARPAVSLYTAVSLVSLGIQGLPTVWFRLCLQDVYPKAC